MMIPDDDALMVHRPGPRYTLCQLLSWNMIHRLEDSDPMRYIEEWILSHPDKVIDDG